MNTYALCTPSHQPMHKQRGAVLIVSLVILLVLTMLGVQGMQTSTLEEKMAGNFRDKKLAFEAAEAALKAAEGVLNLSSTPPIANSSGSNGVYTFASATINSYSFWSGVTGTNTNLPGLQENPKYVIEERGVQSGSGVSKNAEAGAVSKSNFQGTTYGYRITARGTGGTANTVVILQSDFDRVY